MFDEMLLYSVMTASATMLKMVPPKNPPEDRDLFLVPVFGRLGHRRFGGGTHRFSRRHPSLPLSLLLIPTQSLLKHGVRTPNLGEVIR